MAGDFLRVLRHPLWAINKSCNSESGLFDVSLQPRDSCGGELLLKPRHTPGANLRVLCPLLPCFRPPANLLLFPRASLFSLAPPCASPATQMLLKRILVRKKGSVSRRGFFLNELFVFSATNGAFAVHDAAPLLLPGVDKPPPLPLLPHPPPFTLHLDKNASDDKETNH